MRTTGRTPAACPAPGAGNHADGPATDVVGRPAETVLVGGGADILEEGERAATLYPSL